MLAEHTLGLADYTSIKAANNKVVFFMRKINRKCMCAQDEQESIVNFFLYKQAPKNKIQNKENTLRQIEIKKKK